MGSLCFTLKKQDLRAPSLPTEFWAHLHEQEEGLGQLLVIHETQGTRSHWMENFYFSVLPHGWRICFLSLQDMHLSPPSQKRMAPGITECTDDVLGFVPCSLRWFQLKLFHFCLGVF